MTVPVKTSTPVVRVVEAHVVVSVCVESAKFGGVGLGSVKPQ